ncbi:MAG: hypothetical protein HYW33_03715, partial [Candidatus Blackburnbacteria bacterium]|nr:hypothetical protein [Candidatus Blackburnbacteria bacterium]
MATKPQFSDEFAPRSERGPARNTGGWSRDDRYRSEGGSVYMSDANLPTEYIEGVLDIAQEGSGLLRPPFGSKDDRNVYISGSQIRRFNLRSGDIVGGQARSPKENERYWGLLKVEKVNGQEAQEGDRVKFEDLTPVHPDEKIKLETTTDKLTTRVIDLISPIGFGQRGLIVSPPKAGKT